MRLMREVRCFPLNQADAARPVNSWAGCPARGGVEPFWRLQAVVEGPVDPQTGYLCNIKEIDQAVRSACVPLLVERTSEVNPQGGGISHALPDAFRATAIACDGPMTLKQLTVLASPFLRFSVRQEETTMVLLTQSFEFSAAHRLYCPELSEAENRRVFGKCSNANGHGHNYVLDVTIGQRANGRDEVHPRELSRIVHELVIERFDHKHLNLDCEEFATLNPSVENLARVIWKRLAGDGGVEQLATVRIWETPKTYAEYDGSQ